MDKYSLDNRIDKIYSVLGGIGRDLGQNEIALENFIKAAKLNPDSELASLGLYVTLTSIDKDQDAIEEMKRFLKNHQAKLYRDTLEELLGDLQKGFMTNYKDDITKLARINGFDV